MGYAKIGGNLEIDVANGKIERVEADPNWMNPHLGGLGTGVKLHYGRVSSEVQSFDPENLLIFSSCHLCGTPAFSTNRSLIGFVPPQTNLLAYPMMGVYLDQ
jgi:aldehyde:ferredoxin oxidoreductase